MEQHEISPPDKQSHIPDEMKRAKYWANLLDKAAYKNNIYLLAKENLDSANKNSIKQDKAKKILAEAIKRYEEIYNR